MAACDLTPDYRLNFDQSVYIKAANPADPTPTARDATYTRVWTAYGAGRTLDGDLTEVVDYRSRACGAAQLPGAKTVTLPLMFHADTGSKASGDAYHLLRQLSQSSGPDSAVAYWVEVPPEDGSDDDPDITTGIGYVSNWDPGNREASNVDSVTVNIGGTSIGATYPQGRPVATLATDEPGSGLTDGSYTDVALVGVTPNVGRLGLVDITVTTGAVSLVAVAASEGSSSGFNYRIGQKLTVAIADIGGAGVAPVFSVDGLKPTT